MSTPDDQKKEEPRLFADWTRGDLEHYIETLKDRLSRSEVERIAGLDRVMEEAKKKMRPNPDGTWTPYLHEEDLQTIIDSEKAR